VTLVNQRKHSEFVKSPTPDSILLAGLDDSVVQTMVEAARVRRLGSNETLIAEGQPADQLFLIKSGTARFYRLTKTGEDIALLWLVPGDIVGLGSLLADHASYLANAETVSACEFLVWDHARIRGFALDYPAIFENGMGLSLNYLRDSLGRHVDLATKPPHIRLARSLMNLARKIGTAHSLGVEIAVNNEHLSSLADVSHFTASRVLAGWARSGRVTKQRGKVIVHAPDTLIQ
jgi:CRP-like cAMP-binding protein